MPSSENSYKSSVVFMSLRKKQTYHYGFSTHKSITHTHTIFMPIEFKQRKFNWCYILCWQHLFEPKYSSAKEIL